MPGPTEPGPLDSSGLAPVVRESTPSLIARELRRAIARGRFAPGAQLGESALARELGVSRGPLREAMQRLTQEGLLVSHPGRGLFVPELTGEQVEDIFLLRFVVERAAIELVHAREAGAEAAARLESVVADMERAAGSGDEAALAEADLAFHRVLVEAAGSPRLIRVHDTVLVETSLCLHAMSPSYDRAEERIAEHQRLRAAIEAGDPERAVALLDEHMRDGRARATPS